MRATYHEPSIEPPWDRIIGNSPLNTAEGIEEALGRLEHFAQDNHGTSSYVRFHSEFLRRVKDGTDVGDYVRQLNALMAVDTDKLSVYQLTEALKERLDAWEYHPSVRQWRENLPKLLAQTRFHALFYDDEFAEYQIRRWEADLGVARSAIADHVLSELPKHIRNLSAKALLGWASMLVPSLPRSGALTALKHSVASRIEAIRLAKLTVAEINLGAVAEGTSLESALLWFLFGHPDKRRRWQAVHAARLMVRLGNRELVAQLVRWLDSPGQPPFAIPDTPFYSLAARHWLFLLIDRLAAEVPDALLPLAPRIAAEATSPETPHALIMRLAKRAALRLAEHPSTPYVAEERQRIEGALRPKIKKRAKAPKQGRRTARPTKAHEKRRFDFDRMDTLRYWYDTPAELFGISVSQFCGEAERWICDRWGYRGSVWGSDPVRQWRDDRDWTLYSHSHGSPPTIEDLQTYLEFNAMFCAAAELARRRPVVPARWHWGKDPWEEWLERWDLADPSGWAADRRGRTPFEPAFWTAPDHDAWKGSAKPEDFDRVSGFVQPLHEEFVVVDAYTRRSHHKNSEDMRVATALVSPETASALLHALYSSAHPHDYRVPPRGDDLEIDESLAGTSFRLRGWIKDIRRDNEGIEEHDPLRGRFYDSSPRLSKEFVRWAGLRFRRNRTVGFRPEDPRRPVVLSERWNDVERNDREYEFATEGHRLWIRFTELIAFLGHVKQCLLVESQINRFFEAPGVRSSGRTYVSEAKLYLIHPDGTVESPGAGPRAWQEDR